MSELYNVENGIGMVPTYAEKPGDDAEVWVYEYAKDGVTCWGYSRVRQLAIQRIKAQPFF